jgi:hypothetical protein
VICLHLADEEGEFKIECLIFEATEQGLRILFKHGSFACGSFASFY